VAASVPTHAADVVRLVADVDRLAGDVLARQISRHHSLEIVRWTSADQVLEALALYCYAVECEADARQTALHIAISQERESRDLLARRHSRIRELVEQIRQARNSPERAA
jgi:hypothetical protein